MAERLALNQDVAGSTPAPPATPRYVGSLCSGIGGSDLGFAAAGWTIAWQVERNDFRRAILRDRFPDAVHGHQVEHTEWLKHQRHVDLLYAEPMSVEPPDVDPVLNAIDALRPPRALVDVGPGHDPKRYEVVAQTLMRSGYDVVVNVFRYAMPGSEPRARAVFAAVKPPIPLPQMVLAIIHYYVGGATFETANLIDEEALSVDDLERARGFPEGWTCLGHRDDRCTCPSAARHKALRDAGSPLFGYLIASWLDGAVAESV